MKYKMDEQEQDQRSSSSTPTSSNWGAVKTFIGENKIDSLLWITRIFTVINVLLYILPFISPVSTYSCYRRAMISNAAVSALRLHQRLPNVQLTREYLGQLFLEDSCHYLMYSLMFLYNSYPLSAAVIPLGLFALLHTSSFSKKLLDILGTSGVFGMSLVRWARSGIDKLQENQQTLLRFIASTEVLIMCFTVFLVFSGGAGLLLPFFYYKFVTLRYASRRNPYSRILFGHFRLVVENAAMNQRCPLFLSNIMLAFVRFVSNLAPPVQQTATAN